VSIRDRWGRCGAGGPLVEGLSCTDGGGGGMSWRLTFKLGPCLLLQ
jgi:hypothetical protein